ncbi:MAG: Phage terminase, small subunit [Firmicutes bacterium]|jgi:phage terminase small subunit|nr:Phage terminase, small subunit [Bacillota bacterium]
MKRLSPLQEKFCLEYVKTGFVGQSYINAGYKAKNKVIAEANGRRLLEKEYIKKRIKELMDEIQSKEIATAEEVLKYLTKGMRMELYEEVVVVENVGDYQSEARTIKKQISIKDANKCAELLAKRFGLLTDNLNLSGEMAVKIVDDINDED